MSLLTQNSELKPHGIFNWTIPAWFTRLSNGDFFKTCPNAGACAKVCYARNGTYLFRNVAKAHKRNLEMVLDDRYAWKTAMIEECSAKRLQRTGVPRVLPEGAEVHLLDVWLRNWVHTGGKAVRIHDAGDFFAEWYLELWIQIAEECPHILFYAYTKEVTMFKTRQSPYPINFRYLFSTGGLQDDLIMGNDRHADVFPSEEAIQKAGYMSQDASDLLAVLLPTTRIGIPANNIKHFNKKIDGRRFSEM